MLLVAKEIKAGKIQAKDLTDEKKRKIKIFVTDYMDKVILRRTQKQQKHNSNAGQDGPGPSDSVSTGTPHQPGSTPRERTTTSVEQDDGGVQGVQTPMSRSVSKTPGGEGEVERERGEGIADIGV